MKVDPEKVRVIRDWPRPKDKTGVKSFLQTVQFCKVFMRPRGDRMYVDVTTPEETDSKISQIQLDSGVSGHLQ